MEECVVTPGESPKGIHGRTPIGMLGGTYREITGGILRADPVT